MRPFGPAYKKDVPLLERPFYMASPANAAALYPLVKPIELLHHFIDCHRNIPSAPSRQIYTSAQNTQAKFSVDMDVFVSQVFPQILFLLQIFLRAGAYQHDGGYGCDNVQIPEQILAQMFVADPLAGHGIDHETVHQKLLVNPAYHHILMY